MSREQVKAADAAGQVDPWKEDRERREKEAAEKIKSLKTEIQAMTGKMMTAAELRRHLMYVQEDAAVKELAQAVSGLRNVTVLYVRELELENKVRR